MKKNGNMAGLFSGVFWGLNTVLIAVVLMSPVFISFGSAAPLIATFLHDGFSFFFLLIVLHRERKQIVPVLKSKAGRIIGLAALLGGPIGMGAYILSIRYLGATLSSSFSAIHPAFGAILAYFLLKERLKLRNLFGIALSIFAIILMGMGTFDKVPDFTIGLIFALLCIVAWGSEAVMVNLALKEDVSAEMALLIRQMISFLIYALVIMPLLGYHSLLMIDVSEFSIYILLLASLVGTLSFLLYYKAIAWIGASRAMGLNIAYPAWAFFFQFMLSGEFDFRTLLLVILIICGAILSAEDPWQILPIFRKKKRVS